MRREKLLFCVTGAMDATQRLSGARIQTSDYMFLEFITSLLDPGAPKPGLHNLLAGATGYLIDVSELQTVH